jgi:hypothetical protein
MSNDSPLLHKDSSEIVRESTTFVKSRLDISFAPATKNRVRVKIESDELSLCFSSLSLSHSLFLQLGAIILTLFFVLIAASLH